MKFCNSIRYSTATLVGRSKASENPSNHWKATHTGPHRLRGKEGPLKTFELPMGTGTVPTRATRVKRKACLGILGRLFVTRLRT